VFVLDDEALRAEMIPSLIYLGEEIHQDKSGTAAKPKRRSAADRRQTNLLLPVSGKKKETATPATVTALPRRRRKA
jgi:hypothetical protein